MWPEASHSTSLSFNIHGEVIRLTQPRSQGCCEAHKDQVCEIAAYQMSCKGSFSEWARGTGFGVKKPAFSSWGIVDKRLNLSGNLGFLFRKCGTSALVRIFCEVQRRRCPQATSTELDGGEQQVKEGDRNFPSQGHLP